eukprot:3781738-Rhodomonas_salina.1
MVGSSNSAADRWVRAWLIGGLVWTGRRGRDLRLVGSDEESRAALPRALVHLHRVSAQSADFGCATGWTCSQRACAMPGRVCES